MQREEPHPGRRIVTEPARIAVSDPVRSIEYEIYGSAPVQAFGTVAGRDIYFWARHRTWSLDIADHNGNLPSDGCADADSFYREGECENASYMPFEQAMQIIDRCLLEYEEGRAG
jgi:hypothetical protein